MRISCNGCRVLRKGCTENCSLRPCLQWIKSPESQSNATFFLAKFYGRAGLMNLINAGPDHLRPAIFRSLLYEACGRIVNPIYGSAGLMWSGSWQLCQAAVEAVLNGAPIVQISSESAACNMSPPLKACDIRHVSKDETSAASSHKLHGVKTRSRFKRSAAKPKPKADSAQATWPRLSSTELEESASRDSGPSQRSRGAESAETDSMSVETVEPSLVVKRGEEADGIELELELTLGFEPVRKKGEVEVVKEGDEIDGSRDGTCEVKMTLDCFL